MSLSDWVLIVTTLFLGAIAIWGDNIRALFSGPKLELIPYNFRGAVVPVALANNQQGRAIFYHLQVKNLSKTVSAKNCRVLLKKLWLRVPNGEYQEIELTVPLTFIWSPREITPPYITIVKEQVLDFGILIEGENLFRPVLLSYTNNFRGFIQPNGAIRYGLEIVSDDFVSKNLQVFEVAWNGGWSDNLDSMAQNLQIKEVKMQ